MAEQTALSNDGERETLIAIDDRLAELEVAIGRLRAEIAVTLIPPQAEVFSEAV